MANLEVERQLPELLRWIKRPIPWDPVPDWLFERLDIAVLSELMLADLEFERNILQQQVEQLDRKREILKRGLGQ